MGIVYDRDYYDDKTLTVDEPLRFARIGYDNFVTEANITASSDIAGFEESALGNGFTYELWKPSVFPATLTVNAGSAVTADYMGLAVQGLSGCLIRLSYSADGLAYTTIREAVIVNDRASMFLFDSVTAQYWQIEILQSEATLSLDFVNQVYLLGDFTDSGGTYIGVLHLGQSLQMQRGIYQGHTPVTLAAQNEIRPTRSEGGQWLGRSVVRRGYQTSYEWNNLTAEWYRDNFDPFARFAVTSPFFVAWRPEGYADEAVYGWTEQDITPTNSGPRDYMSVSMTVTGHGDLT